MVVCVIERSQNQAVDVTFFVPCFNEERCVTATLANIAQSMASQKLSYEIIVMDDYSTDNTLTVVKDYCQRNPRVPLRLYSNEANRGLGYAYFNGARLAKGRFYMIINGGNVEPPETIPALLRFFGRADMIIPYHPNKKYRRFSRQILSTTFTNLVNLLSGHHVPYYNGPVLQRLENVLRWENAASGFGFQAELISCELDHGCSYLAVPITQSVHENDVTHAFELRNVISVVGSLVRILFRRIITIFMHSK